MKRIILSLVAVSLLVFTSCSKDKEQEPVKQELVAPATYKFEAEGKSTVSFSGQVARLKMAGELKSALNSNTKTLAELTEMFKGGKGFEEASLNASGKKLRSTVASATYSNVTTAEQQDLQTKMDGWISDFTTSVVPNWTKDASAGKPGRLSYEKDGKENYRYVNAKGIEINQAVAKTLIGAVFADQMINKYVSQTFIDENKAGNDSGALYKEGANYTKLQHGWDEAYGYVFGLEEDTTKPDSSKRVGFLNSYLKSLNNDDDFKGILDEVYNAFKLGRAAINAKDYEVVSKQAEIIRNAISKVIAVRAVYYLQNGKGAKDASKLHALSEGYGFVQSLRFIHANGAQVPEQSVKAVLKVLEADNGLWSVTDEQLDSLSKTLASYFDFTVEQASK